MATTLAILAGGSGTRMGTPKAELKVHGKPILEHIFEQVAWPGPTILVTAPGVEHPPGYKRFTSEVSDPVGGEGPLRGILTALGAANAPGILVTTVDMPNVTREQLEWLETQFSIMEHCMALACRRESGMVEPFPCAIRTTAMAAIQRLLVSPHRSMKQLFELPDSHVVSAPADWLPSLWVNLNHPEDLDLIEA